MQENGSKTKMVSDAQSKEVKMEAKVKIKTLLAIALGKDASQLIVPGTIVEVTPEEAAEFCDRALSGYYDHDGEKSENRAKKEKIVRAVRV